LDRKGNRDSGGGTFKCSSLYGLVLKMKKIAVKGDRDCTGRTFQVICLVLTMFRDLGRSTSSNYSGVTSAKVEGTHVGLEIVGTKVHYLTMTQEDFRRVSIIPFQH
jgi:hypothetical protein